MLAKVVASFQWAEVVPFPSASSFAGFPFLQGVVWEVLAQVSQAQLLVVVSAQRNLGVWVPN